MFGPITLPYGAKMLFNTVKLKPGVTFDDVELAVGELCSVVKETYGGDKGGFIAGQVFKFSGFLSDEGSLNAPKHTDEHYAIVTYWRSFEDHEQSHADRVIQQQVRLFGRHVFGNQGIGLRHALAGRGARLMRRKGSARYLFRALNRIWIGLHAYGTVKIISSTPALKQWRLPCDGSRLYSSSARYS